MDTFENDTRIGTVLNNRYLITERIATGGMGIVYLGERIELGRPVAIKFLHQFFHDNKLFVSRFECEARAMSQLFHPCCVPVIDFGVDKTAYIVMEYVPGETLKEMLLLGRIEGERAMKIGTQLLAALSHAHAHEIIHRDVKPANVMVCQVEGLGEHVRLFDFGLAELNGTGQDLGQSPDAMFAGTPNYMSPEQCQGARADARSDIYSAGVVLFEMLTGRKPFVDTDPINVIRMQIEDNPPSLRQVDASIPFSAQIEGVLRKALAKRPDDRFQTAQQFIDALKATPEGGAREYTSLEDAELRHVAGQLVRRSIVPAVKTKNKLEEMLEDLSIFFAVRFSKLSAGQRLRIGLIAGMLVLLNLVGGAWLVFARREEVSKATAAPLIRTRPKAATRGSADPALFPQAASLPSAPATRGQIGKEQAAGVDSNDRAVEPQAELGALEMVFSEDQAYDPDDDPDTDVSLEHGLDRARELIDKGQWDKAIRRLMDLYRGHGADPRILFLLANTYFEKKWWGDAMELYQRVIRIDDEYRTNPTVLHNLIAALESDKTLRKAREILLNDIGPEARPHLFRSAVESRSFKVRYRAKALAEQLAPPPEDAGH